MKKNIFCENKDIFTNIYLNNKWGCGESRSGPGSKISNNKKFLQLFEDFCKLHKIETIIDCGCGDFNWMKLFDFGLINKYLGLDIVDDLIVKNNKTYSNNIIRFEIHSIVKDLIPAADVVLCKDVLFHLSFSDAIATINNIKKSNSKYFISTTFYGFNNFDIKTGGWRLETN